ncbi:NAD(P)-dependent oxidoreductase [Aeromicrobium sp. CF4.19]|uniref:NAD(P)-dependent oxidoreductase n=1 Tax=Aeromicrobium sp. CF4.19 TaxID=3373082 RepID=UPI003EE6CC81
MSTADTRVSVLGLGNLGLAMAERLVEAGFPVTGYDVVPAARTHAAERGIQVEDSAAAAAVDADVVCLAVGTAAQVRECLDSLAESSAVHLVHATIAPADMVALGGDVLDAPVSGGPDRARSGSLAVMVGGAADLVERARPVLDSLGRTLLTGDVGSAQVTKLVGQIVFMTTQGALLEGERLATSYGVAWPDALAALGEGTADSWAVRNWGFFDEVAADYDRSGLDPGMRPWAKDLATALSLAADHEIDLPLTSAAARHVPPAIDTHARPDP